MERRSELILEVGDGVEGAVAGAAGQPAAGGQAEVADRFGRREVGELVVVRDQELVLPERVADALGKVVGHAGAEAQASIGVGRAGEERVDLDHAGDPLDDGFDDCLR